MNSSNAGMRGPVNFVRNQLSRTVYKMRADSAQFAPIANLDFHTSSGSILHMMCLQQHYHIFLIIFLGYTVTEICFGYPRMRRSGQCSSPAVCAVSESKAIASSIALLLAPLLNSSIPRARINSASFHPLQTIFVSSIFCVVSSN